MDPVQDSAVLPTSNASSSSSLASTEKQKGDTHSLVVSSNNDKSDLTKTIEKESKESPKDVSKHSDSSSPVAEEKKYAQPSVNGTNSQRRRRGGNGQRSSRGRRQAGKRGEWKKLDVEVSFTKNTSPGNGGGSRRGGKNASKNITSKAEASPENQNDASNKSTSSSSTPEKKGSNNRRGKGRNNNQNGYNRSNSDTPDTNPNWRERHHQPRKNSKYSNNSNSRRHKQNGSASYRFPKLTQEQLKNATDKALSQIEFFFSNDELCRNTYLRHLMDVEGYLPAAIVFNFPSVMNLSVPYQVLMDALNTDSSILEVDKVNETLRLRENYKQWLYPNENGGYGCPRWIKQASPESTNEKVENQGVESEADNKKDTATGTAEDEGVENHQSNDTSSTEEEKLEENIEKITDQISAVQVDSSSTDDMRQ